MLLIVMLMKWRDGTDYTVLVSGWRGQMATGKRGEHKRVGGWEGGNDIPSLRTKTETSGFAESQSSYQNATLCNGQTFALVLE